jgi:ferredoxin/flavodoxin
MITRRQFLTGAGAVLLGGATGCADHCDAKPAPPTPVRNRDPQSALVLWYSHAGHTERMGKLIARTFEREGLKVVAGELKGFDLTGANEFDLVMAGSPVHYMDLPQNVRAWLQKLPALRGAAVASWVTYGGRGSNFVNTGFGLLELLAAKQGAPVGRAAFGNMNTFAPSLTGSGARRVLGYRHLPNEETYNQCRGYARRVLADTRAGKLTAIEHEFDFSGLLTSFNPMQLAKRGIKAHYIDKRKCIDCGTCAAHCPVDAIRLGAEKTIDRARCIFCCGCLNRCPADAVRMTYFGESVVGWPAFCREHEIVIKEPAELGG